MLNLLITARKWWLYRFVTPTYMVFQLISVMHVSEIMWHLPDTNSHEDSLWLDCSLFRDTLGKVLIVQGKKRDGSLEYWVWGRYSEPSLNRLRTGCQRYITAQAIHDFLMTNMWCTPYTWHPIAWEIMTGMLELVVSGVEMVSHLIRDAWELSAPCWDCPLPDS